VSASAWNVVIEFVGLLVNGVGLGFVAIQVSLGRRQARHTQLAQERDLELRRKESTMAHLIATDDQMRKYQAHLPDDFDATAVAAYITRAIADQANTGEALVGYLGYWETLALGTSLGVYDLETVCRMSGARISVLVENYRPYFRHRRASTGVATLYSEIEWLDGRIEDWRQSLPAERRLALRTRQPPVPRSGQSSSPA
jgi:hypothetical protein